MINIQIHTMKCKILSFTLLSILVTIYYSCKKTETPAPVPDTRFPLPSIIKDTTSDQFISGKNPEDFHGKFVVSMYYETEVIAQRVDIVVIRNGNKSNVKVLKTGVTSFPTTIEITGTQLTTLFDSTIKLGDVFEIGADVLAKDGRSFVGFPSTGDPYGVDTTTLTNPSFSIKYVADCVYDKTDYNGFYKLLTKTWDYEVGDLVEVRPGAGDTLLITAWPHPDVGIYTRWPMKVIVDPSSHEVSIPFQSVGEYAGGPSHLIDGGDGTVSPCGDKITLSVIFWVGSYYGPMPLELGK
jgi:hypothetical protein